MTIRLSKIVHIQEYRDNMGKVFYRKTRTNRTHTVDLQEWSGTQEERGKFITKLMNDFKI